MYLDGMDQGTDENGMAMMPRIAALAEIQWSKPENKDIQNFLRRLKHQIDIYKLYGYNYKEDIHEALDK